MIVATGDFTGKFALSKGMYNVADYQAYIDKYEPQYLKELLGVELYDEFIIDLTLGGGVPTEARFLTIFEPLNFDYNFRVYTSEGMKKMLVAFIYFEIVRDYDNQMTPIGNVAPKGENSDRVTAINSTMWDRYNEGVKSYKAIQRHIINNASDYDHYNGQNKLYSTWL